MIPSPAPPGSPTGWMLPREFAFAARPNGDHFSEGSLSTAPPGSPTAYISPRDFALLARPPGCHFSEGFRARLPDRLHFSEGFCFHRLAHRSSLFRRTSSPAPPGSPTAYISPREFAVTARPPGCHLSEGFRARLPDRLHFSEGFCFHRSAHRSTLFRGIFEPGTVRLPDRLRFSEGFC